MKMPLEGCSWKLAAMLSTMMVFARSLPMRLRSLILTKFQNLVCSLYSRYEIQPQVSITFKIQSAYYFTAAVNITISYSLLISFRKIQAKGRTRNWPQPYQLYLQWTRVQSRSRTSVQGRTEGGKKGGQGSGRVDLKLGGLVMSEMVSDSCWKTYLTCQENSFLLTQTSYIISLRKGYTESYSRALWILELLEARTVSSIPLSKFNLLRLSTQEKRCLTVSNSSLRPTPCESINSRSISGHKFTLIIMMLLLCTQRTTFPSLFICPSQIQRSRSPQTVILSRRRVCQTTRFCLPSLNRLVRASLLVISMISTNF